MKLGELCEIVRGSSPRPKGDARFYGGSIPRLMVADVTRDGKYVTPKIDFLTQEGAALSRPMKKGDLVIAVSGNPGLAAILETDACIHDGFVGLRNLDSQSISVDYLYRYLVSFKEQINSKAVGAIFKNLTTHQIADIEIPLPPLEEQQRIAAILDKADAVRKKRSHAIQLTEKLLRATFLDMFGDPVTNSKGWEVCRLDEVATIESGVTKGRKLDQSKIVTVPYMRVANVQDGYLDLNEIKEIEVLSTEVEKYALKKGDLLLTEGGDPDKLGRGSVWYEKVPLCIHQNHIFRVRSNHILIQPEFLSILIASERGKRYFLRAAKQTTGIATINMTQLRGFPILLPPISLQEEYMKVVEKQRIMLRRANSHMTEINNLFNSLLHRAFRGEL